MIRKYFKEKLKLHEDLESQRHQLERMGLVVIILVLLQIIVYSITLKQLLKLHFWDSEYALNEVQSILKDSNYMSETYTSYLTTRYVFFLPHVMGAFIWWNLYFFQIIPSIRRKYKAFHRWLGRLLLLTATLQTWSGVGLAWYSPSSRIKLVSLATAVGTVYCVYFSAVYAIRRDIIRHKYWSTRLIGYMQIIAMQRLCMGILFAMQHTGWIKYLYTGLQSHEMNDNLLKEIFDDSFVLAFVSAVLGTELYLSKETGMMDTSEITKSSKKSR